METIRDEREASRPGARVLTIRSKLAIMSTPVSTDSARKQGRRSDRRFLRWAKLAGVDPQLTMDLVVTSPKAETNASGQTILSLPSQKVTSAKQRKAA